jgi:RNA polymerase sigma-70 factor (ECF subfamily)
VNRQIDAAIPVLTPSRRNRVRSILMLGGVPFDGVEDGVQQVQLKLIEAGQSGQPPIRNIDAWIGVVASRVALDSHRHNARVANLRQRLEQQRHHPVGHEQDRVLAQVVADELEALRPSERQILTLRYFVDLTVSQIASVLSIPEGTVKSRFNTASANLRNWLSENDPRHD